MQEFIIGRQDVAESPRLAVTSGGKTVLLGEPGSVPKSVSRKHLRIEVGDDMKLTVVDITSGNVTYVNGAEIKRKGGVAPDAEIELGTDRYQLDIQGILKAFSSKKTYSIGYLNSIYENYHRAKLDYQIKQNKLNAMSALPGLLSMASIALVFVFKEEALRAVMIGVALVMAIAFAVIRIKNASQGPLYLKQLDDRFREEYSCPNPLCKRHFMAPYKDLISSKSCPYCKSKFKE